MICMSLGLHPSFGTLAIVSHNHPKILASFTSVVFLMSHECEMTWDVSEPVIVIISGASLVEGSFLAEATCSLHGIQKKLGKDLQVPRRIVQTREEFLCFGQWVGQRIGWTSVWIQKIFVNPNVVAISCKSSSHFRSLSVVNLKIVLAWRLFEPLQLLTSLYRYLKPLQPCFNGLLWVFFNVDCLPTW